MDILNCEFDVPGIDKGHVTLIDFMPHPQTGISGDLAVVNAARVSFLGESKGEVADKKLLFYLLRNQHTSPFEQVEFKFRIKAPLITWWQLVRHRSAHLNLQSGRYTPFEEDEFHIPQESAWRKQSASNKQGSSDDTFTTTEQFAIVNQLDVAEVINASIEVQQTLTDLLIEHTQRSWGIYNKLVQEGAAKEQARLFLPGFASMYTGIWKIDAHNLMHFLKLRMAQEAQFEIRTYASTIYEQIFKPMLPWTAEAFELYSLNKER